MTAIRTYRFSRYTLRPAGTAMWDFRLAREWTEADPDHNGRVNPLFWVKQEPEADAYLVLDQDGPLFFFKIAVAEHTGEIHIQFPPHPEDPAGARRLRARISIGLTEGIQWLEKMLIQAHINTLCFESRNPALIAFCTKRLGFTLDGEKLTKMIGPTNPNGEILWGGLHNNVRSN